MMCETHDDVGDMTGAVRAGLNGSLTLRDYFAGQALAGLLANPDEDKVVRRRVLFMAALAYDYADALLATRGQPQWEFSASATST